MIGWVNDQSFTILWDEPVRPAGLVNISSSDFTGHYIVGLNFFHTKDFILTSIFRRNVAGQAEEFLLGAISVLLIAILSEIVQAVLMHTRRKRKRASHNGVKVAFLVDEVYHFRNVVSHVFGRHPAAIITPEESIKRRKRACTSIAVLCIALALMAADVFAVFLTQPNFVASRNEQYNLRGVQPVTTEQGRAKWLRRLARDRICVTPSFTESGQKREFSVNACTMFDTQKALVGVDNYTDEITVSSFFHLSGSDHFVQFGDGRIHIRSRAFLFKNHLGALRITFEIEDLEDFAFHKFLHELFIYSAIEHSCNHNDTTNDCDGVHATMQRLQGRQLNKSITLFTSKDRERTAVVAGWETKYQVRMNNAFESIDHGVSPLVATGMLEEVSGPGTYLTLDEDEEVKNIDGLIVEEGRLAGLLLFLTIFIVFSITLIVLRTTLHPMSLGEMAWKSLETTSTPSADLFDKPELHTGSQDGSSTCFEYDEALGSAGDEFDDSALGQDSGVQEAGEEHTTKSTQLPKDRV